MNFFRCMHQQHSTQCFQYQPDFAKQGCRKSSRRICQRLRGFVSSLCISMAGGSSRSTFMARSYGWWWRWWRTGRRGYRCHWWRRSHTSASSSSPSRVSRIVSSYRRWRSSAPAYQFRSLSPWKSFYIIDEALIVWKSNHSRKTW